MYKLQQQIEVTIEHDMVEVGQYQLDLLVEETIRAKLESNYESRICPFCHSEVVS